MYEYYELDKKLIKCHPTERQLEIQNMEFYAFVHFNMNTFTTGEAWGEGTEPEELFNPLALNADQWVETIKSAGMAGLILTCKHHDGFCLWPSAYTEHSVKNSPFRDGKGDVVREVADACAKGGIKFGVYLSPWDRNCKVYGQGKPYDDYFCAQLTELLTQYGEIFSVWFDGACGEGPNGKRQVYDFDRYFALIRKLQPNACISISGPDVRWCGNESGDTRESEWSVLAIGADDPDATAAISQKTSDPSFSTHKIDPMAMDLGSRKKLEKANGYLWYPAETDISIRPNWFYQSSDDDKVYSTEKLIDIWYRTVGGNSLFLLNIPPDKRGLFCSIDQQRLREMGEYIRQTFSVNYAENAVYTADRDDGYHTAEVLKIDTYDAYYKPLDGENTAVLTVALPQAENITHVVIKEHIPMSQRVERFAVDILRRNHIWHEVGSGTTIGYKKIVKFDPVNTTAVRIRILDSRVCPVLSFVGIY